MKRSYSTTISLIALFLTTCVATAQIGVNTTSPTANLDVNGTLRIRSLEKKPAGFQAIGKVMFVMGVDEKGNVIPIEIGENIVLENNKLKVQLPEIDPTPISLPDDAVLSDLYDGNSAQINNMKLGIVLLPGDRRVGYPIYRLDNGLNNDKVDITGFEAATDGTMAYIYATSGDIELKKNDNDSEIQNRIEMDKNMKLKKNEFALMMYDSSIAKWVVVSSSGKGND